MTTTRNLGLTLHSTETGQNVLNRIDSNLALVEGAVQTIKSWPSGLPVGTAPGRVVALAPDGQLYFAYDNVPGGQENRLNVVGMTVDAAPIEGEDLRVLLMGIQTFAHAGDVWSAINQDIASEPGDPGDTIPTPDIVFGKIAYLQDGETADLSTQGYVTSDVGDSTNAIAVGLFLPNDFLLVMPVQYQP